MEAPAADDASAAAEIEAAPAREGGVAAADQAPAEPTAEPTAEGTAQAAPSSGAAEEKPKTLLQALGDQSNRNLAVTRRMDYSLAKELLASFQSCHLPSMAILGSLSRWYASEQPVFLLSHFVNCLMSKLDRSMDIWSRSCSCS